MWTREALAAAIAVDRPIDARAEVVVQHRGSDRRSEVWDVTVEPSGTVVIRLGDVIPTVV